MISVHNKEKKVVNLSDRKAELGKVKKGKRYPKGCK